MFCSTVLLSSLVKFKQVYKHETVSITKEY